MRKLARVQAMTGQVGRGRTALGGTCALAFLLALVFWTTSVEARRSDKPASRYPASSFHSAEAAHGFTPSEVRRLERGKSVKRRFEVNYQGDTYQAGLSYRLVEGTPMDVIRALRRPGALVQVIPYGVSATVLSEKDGVSVMKIAQGKRPIVGSYTVRMQWDLRSNSAKFWMDPTFRADIEDIWGTFSAREVRPGLTLVSFGFAFNIRGVASILERKAQTWGLTTADRIADYVNARYQSAPQKNEAYENGTRTPQPPVSSQ